MTNKPFDEEAVQERVEDLASGALRSRLVGLPRNRRVLSLVDQAVISATNMATSIVIGRTCAKAELGLYASGLSLILLVTAVQSALIAVPYTISSPRIADEEHAIYKGSTLLQQGRWRW